MGCTGTLIEATFAMPSPRNPSWQLIQQPKRSSSRPLPSSVHSRSMDVHSTTHGSSLLLPKVVIRMLMPMTRMVVCHRPKLSALRLCVVAVVSCLAHAEASLQCDGTILIEHSFSMLFIMKIHHADALQVRTPLPEQSCSLDPAKLTGV